MSFEKLDLPDLRSVSVEGKRYWRKIRKVVPSKDSWFGYAKINGEKLVVSPVESQKDLPPSQIYSWEIVIKNNAKVVI